MFAYLPRRRLILPIAPAIGGAIGLLIALAVGLMPGALLNSLIDASRLPSVLVGGGGVALLVGIGLWLMLGDRVVTLRIPTGQDGEADLPVLRRADAHPDAPARRLVLAHRDLGAPPPAIPAAREIAIPADLDQPLAAFDPAAIPESPREPVRAVAPLVRFERPQLIDPGDRFETFDLAPHDTEMEPIAAIHALLDRLERGINRPIGSRRLHHGISI